MGERTIYIVCLCILTGAGVVSAGLTCYSYTPFAINFGESGLIEPVTTSVSNKTCKDNEQCSKLQIKDTTNKTYSALDCLDQNICQNPRSWCQNFTSGQSNSFFSACELECCDSDLCVKVQVPEKNETSTIVPTPIGVEPILPRASCFIFAPFQVDFEAKQVIENEITFTENVCADDEMCGGLTLKDANNKTHIGSDCVSKNHCQNPEIFCSTVTDGSEGTFRDCVLECCNKSLCLDAKKVTLSSGAPKCNHYSSFIIEGGKVKPIDSEQEENVKLCQEGELCGRAIFNDHENNTHISLDCLVKTVCEKPSVICRDFAQSNPESPFVDCNIECCLGDMCFSTLPQAPPTTEQPTTTEQSTTTEQPLRTEQPPTEPTLATTSGKTQMTASRMLLKTATLMYLFIFCFEYFLINT